MKLHVNKHVLDTRNPNYEQWKALENNQDWWVSIIDFLKEWFNSDKNISIQTSGSTGKPKSIEVEKQYLINSALKTVHFFKLDANSMGLLCLPINYIAGKMMVIRAVVSGMHLIAIKPSSNPVVKLEQAIDFAAFTPMQAKHALKNIEKLNHIKKLIVGGGQVSKSLTGQMRAFRGFAYETFGMTETYSHIALKQLRPEKQSYFTILEGVSISTTEKQNLVVSAPDLGIDKLETTDIVRLADNNSFVWLGRSDFIINSGGIKHVPELIEQEISHLMDVNFCISAVPDELLQEALVLVVESKQPLNTNTKEEIIELLGGTRKPKYFVTMENLPTTHTGKIDRIELRNYLRNKLSARS